MVDVVKQTLPELPEYIHVIHPEEKINTYDLVDITDIGLVYTTTVGLEMALKGIPVVVAGKTHYRDRGFTDDPNSWVEYFKLLEPCLRNPSSSGKTKRKLTWHGNMLITSSILSRCLSRGISSYGRIMRTIRSHRYSARKARRKYGNSFRYLVGEPLDWANPTYIITKKPG